VGRRSSCALAASAALTAALLSAAYVAVYLRGGPRIIDATSYWLEARALAEGHLAWPLEEPVASVLGRFLVRSDAATAGSAATTRLAVIFPPGYPAVLALGFLAGTPLATGPLLAAALTLATWDLAARVAASGSPHDGRSPGLALVPALAALFSTLCAALRYHTADTMSHGLAALCFTVALSFALRALDRSASAAAGGDRLAPPLRAAVVSGLAAGWLTATRPPSGLALAATLLLLLLRRAPAVAHGPVTPRARLRIAAATALGALPGIALLAAHQRAATGSWASSQAVYYAVSDGPPGCFRYGFGAGVGCLGEHGDFVRHNLASGYGFLAAAGTTLRRLKLHLLDPLNAEPLTALVLAGAALALRRPRARMLALAPLLQIAAYAPFYFDGNYPGGGARFFADVLPLEHILAALAVAAVIDRAPRAGALGWFAVAASLPLAGFALRAGFDHALLRDLEGGVPMFDPAALERAGVRRGLVFIDTDHGFNLGYDPGSTAVQIARHRGDALDRMAWEARGRPPAFLYHFAIPAGGGAPSVSAPSITPLSFGAQEPRPGERVIEGESLWPPLAQRDAWALPQHAGGTCASGSRVLAVHAVAASGDAVVRLGLPAPWLGGAELSPRMATTGGISGAVHVLVDGIEAHVWRLAPGSPDGSLTCSALAPYRISDGASRIELTLVRHGARSEGGASATPERNKPAVEDRATTGAERVFALDALSVVGGKTVDR
jgi:hypothetical protein